MALSACGDTQDLYVKGRCRLYFDNTTHNDATLATAMTPYSGAFVTITAQNSQFVFTSNQGLSSKVNMTAVDTQRGYILGMNNGIIVGYGSSVDGTFFAYDRECPNCYDGNSFSTRSYKISVNEFGIGTCANCQRQYDLNNGGIVSKGDAGNKLSRYYATTTGSYGKLNIQ
jgi:nitrite reductase/ring-hydroxylating ferredoxin subunit